MQRLLMRCLGLITELLSGILNTDINMSYLNQYPQYLSCISQQDKIYIHREITVAYILEYNNEYQHQPRGLGCAQGNTSNWRIK